MDCTRILIVDDEPATRYALTALLIRHRPWLFVETAASVREAEHCMRHLAIRVVITDIRMPGHNGLTLLHQVNPKVIPTIVITADPSDRIKGEAFAAGAYAFIRKPLDRTRFLTILDYALHYPPPQRAGMNGRSLAGTVSS